MIQYQFIFDSEPATQLVDGWQDLQLQATFNNQKRTVKAEGDLVIYDEAIHNYIEGLGPCDIVTLEIQFKSTNTPNWATLHTLSIPAIKITKECEINAYKINFEGQSVLDRLSDKEQEKVSTKLAVLGGSVTLSQPWSGGDLSISENEFVDFKTALEDILQKFVPGATITSNVIGPLAPTYQQEHWEISSIPAVVSGDVVSLVVNTKFGDRFTVTPVVPVAGYTGVQLADILAKGLIFIEGTSTFGPKTIDVGPNQLCGRISEATSSSSTLTIKTDFSLSSISLTVNGSGAGSINQFAAFQYSLKNLRVGVIGGRYGRVDISFGELMAVLQQLVPVVVNDGDSELDISTYRALNLKYPTLSVTGKNAVKAWNQNYKDEFLRINHGFTFDDYAALESGWQWTGATLDISAPILNNLQTWTYTYTGATGPKRMSGYVEVDNTSSSFRTAFIRVDLNGSFLGDSDTFEIPPNAPYADTVKIISWAEVPEFCLTSGDILTFTITMSQGTQVKTTAGTQALLLEGALCFGNPPTREDELEEDQGKLINFIGCGSQKTVTLSNNYYAGLGALWSAIDYGVIEADEKLVHLALIEPTMEEADLFTRSFYFETTDSDVCGCYQGQAVPFYFPNMLLQPRYMMYNYRELPPSGIRVEAFDIATDVDISGVFSQVVTSAEFDIFPRHERLNEFIYPDDMTPEKFLSLLSEEVIEVDLCDVNRNGVLKDFTLTLGSGKTEIKVEA